MLIEMRARGEQNDAGGFYDYRATFDVETDEEAQLAGQKFARLTKALSEGAVAWDRAAYTTDEP